MINRKAIIAVVACILAMLLLILLPRYMKTNESNTGNIEFLKEATVHLKEGSDLLLETKNYKTEDEIREHYRKIENKIYKAELLYEKYYEDHESDMYNVYFKSLGEILKQVQSEDSEIRSTACGIQVWHLNVDYHFMSNILDFENINSITFELVDEKFTLLIDQIDCSFLDEEIKRRLTN